jgi:hypothetical protein
MAKEIVYLAYTRKGVLKYRPYKFYGDESILDVSMEDNVGAFLGAVGKQMPQQVSKALSSIGWHLHKQMKQAIKDGGPLGEHWPELSGVTKRSRVAGGFELFYRKAAHHTFYGALARTIGYYRPELPALKVSVGWLSLAAAKRGEQLQRGFTTKPTRKQRWLFTASARWDKRREFLRSGSIFPMKKDSITVPGRNLVAPVYARQQQNILPIMERKLKLYMRKQEGWFQMTRSNAKTALKSYAEAHS